MAPSLSIFYGSQTGCAESIAQRIYNEALEKGLDATFGPLNDFQNTQPTAAAGAPHHVVVVCSTTGNGDPPDNCAKFWRYIKRRTQPADMMAHVAYTVLGLGDTNYDKFCFMGKSIDKRMRELSAQCFYDMCAADEAMGLEDQVEPWLDGLWAAFAKSSGAADGAETASSSDDDDSGTKHNNAVATAGTATMSYVQEGIATYEIMFGPFSAPTDTPDDVPRLQSSVYSTRFVDASEATTQGTVPTPLDEEYSSTHPFVASVQAARYLTKSHSERKVLYVELDVTGSNIKYNPGDSIGIKCPNREEDVDALLNKLGTDGSALVCVEPVVPKSGARRATVKSSATVRFPSPSSVRDIFMHHVDLLSSPKKAALRALATYCANEEEKARMLVLSSKSGSEKYKQFISDQQLNVVELLHLFPSCNPPLDHLLSLLPQLMPRFYSIATSPLADANKIGIAFTIVDELTGPNSTIRRRGLCTNWLNRVCQPLLGDAATAAPVTIQIPIFLRPTRDFLLPASNEWPLLLIGPGTGVAPFMGFLQHRRIEAKKSAEVASQAVDSNGIYLFFGCRRRSDDWIFEEEMKEYLADGTLRQLHTAFSREQEEKYYVQHELRAQGAVVAELLLQANGYVYVCGDGTQMAKDVHEALRNVLEEHGKLTKEQAEEQLAALAASQRYMRDIW